EDLALAREAGNDLEQRPAARARRSRRRRSRFDARKALCGAALGFRVADGMRVDCLHREPPTQRRPVRSELVEKILTNAGRERRKWPTARPQSIEPFSHRRTPAARRKGPSRS